jgi:uncharacterized membrane protein YbhN (UPF0104 family)
LASARLLGGLAVLAAIAWRLGTGPFIDGVRAVNWWSVVVAGAITAATTACCAFRWQVVARGLDVGIPLPRAIAAYYRSQFLNSVLPAGILGDVHRGVDHGRAAGNLSGGLRAVAWERIAGQTVQLLIAAIVLVALPSPVRSAAPIVFAVALGLGLALAAALRFAPRTETSRRTRAWRAAVSDVRQGLLARRAWPAVTVSSVFVMVGHVAVFLVAAAASGIHAGIQVLCPLVVLVFVAATVPTNVGGWGPREGVAAWAFASAGLGADRGVAVATTFGVLGLIATLPGALVMLADALPRRRRRRSLGHEGRSLQGRTVPSTRGRRSSNVSTAAADTSSGVCQRRSPATHPSSRGTPSGVGERLPRSGGDSSALDGAAQRLVSTSTTGPGSPERIPESSALAGSGAARA